MHPPGKRNERPEKVYEELKHLGSGAFGEAVLVRRRHDGRRFVAKKCCIEDLDEKQRRLCLEEIAVLQRVQHPYVAEVADFRWGSRNHMKYWIVLKYYPGGDVQQQIDHHRQNKWEIPSGKVGNWTTQLCMALDYVHSLKIVHRDVKGSNLFITGADNIVLGDFGASKQLTASVAKAMTSIGSPVFMAPEWWEGRGGTSRSDMWSVGVVLYELAALRRPFEAENMLSLVYKVTSEDPTELPEETDENIKDLVGRLLVKEPQERPSAAEALRSSCLRRCAEILKIYRGGLEHISDRQQLELARAEDAASGALSSRCSDAEDDECDDIEESFGAIEAFGAQALGMVNLVSQWNKVDLQESDAGSDDDATLSSDGQGEVLEDDDEESSEEEEDEEDEGGEEDEEDEEGEEEEDEEEAEAEAEAEDHDEELVEEEVLEEEACKEEADEGLDAQEQDTLRDEQKEDTLILGVHKESTGMVEQEQDTLRDEQKEDTLILGVHKESTAIVEQEDALQGEVTIVIKKSLPGGGDTLTPEEEPAQLSSSSSSLMQEQERTGTPRSWLKDAGSPSHEAASSVKQRQSRSLWQSSPTEGTMGRPPLPVPGAKEFPSRYQHGTASSSSSFSGSTSCQQPRCRSTPPQVGGTVTLAGSASKSLLRSKRQAKTAGDTECEAIRICLQNVCSLEQTALAPLSQNAPASPTAAEVRKRSQLLQRPGVSMEATRLAPFRPQETARAAERQGEEEEQACLLGSTACSDSWGDGMALNTMNVDNVLAEAADNQDMALSAAGPLGLGSQSLLQGFTLEKSGSQDSEAEEELEEVDDEEEASDDLDEDGLDSDFASSVQTEGEEEEEEEEDEEREGRDASHNDQEEELEETWEESATEGAGEKEEEGSPAKAKDPGTMTAEDWRRTAVEMQERYARLTAQMQSPEITMKTRRARAAARRDTGPAGSRETLSNSVWGGFATRAWVYRSPSSTVTALAQATQAEHDAKRRTAFGRTNAAGRGNFGITFAEAVDGGGSADSTARETFFVPPRHIAASSHTNGRSKAWAASKDASPSKLRPTTPGQTCGLVPPKKWRPTMRTAIAASPKEGDGLRRWPSHHGFLRAF